MSAAPNKKTQRRALSKLPASGTRAVVPLRKMTVLGYNSRAAVSAVVFR
jgi:hypothetical protein